MLLNSLATLKLRFYDGDFYDPQNGIKVCFNVAMACSDRKFSAGNTEFGLPISYEWNIHRRGGRYAAGLPYFTRFIRSTYCPFCKLGPAEGSYVLMIISSNA